MRERISEEIESVKYEMAETLMKLVRIPAISPDNGGEGEYEKAKELLKIIEGWDFDEIGEFDAPDERAKGGIRPNLIACYKGESSRRRLWILTHLDVVPGGDESKWKVTKPFHPVMRDGRIYGRGAEDNGQSLIASLYSVKALMNMKIRPKRDVLLAFVSDEETGSRYGVKWLIENHRELFRKDDLFLVPDGGKKEGDFIEIAEKSILWMELKVKGKQVHGSTPHKGINAHRVALEFAGALDRFLHEKYSMRDEIFDPPESTFEPTISENDSRAPNVIPGEHRVVFDCRVLPRYNLDEIVEDTLKLAENFERRFQRDGIPEIQLNIIQKFQAPEPTGEDSEIVRLLEKAIREMRGIEPRKGGIGGGTFASFLRALGISAAVWETVDETAHQPDEYSRIENMVEDAKVMAYLPLI
ncbi:MAG: M20 family metallo-hydrolase [Archaeoglobi archaeon]|nr:M20 family metallo-hydrolase [Candidatus Mnemosynella bozhongmuii]